MASSLTATSSTAWHGSLSPRRSYLPYGDADVIPRLYHVAGPAERLRALRDRKEALYRELLRAQAKALPGATALLAARRAAGYRQAPAHPRPRKTCA